MKKICVILVLLLISSSSLHSQCTTTNATSCACPQGDGTNCDLIPDISIARLPLTQAGNYTEYPQVCNPSCNGNQGRLRMGVSTPIIGYGPLETRGTSIYVCGSDTDTAATVSQIPATCPITGLAPKQLINQRVYHKSGNTMTYTDRAAGTMTYHASHGHQHVDEWGEYTLRTSTTDPNPLNWPIIGTGTKLGFCLLDISSCGTNPGNGYCTDSLGNVLHSGNIVNYGLGGGNYGCSNTVQGISNGYMDTYSQNLDGMWIVIPPGTCNGTYYVVVQIDANNNFLETNENNNIVAVPFTLTKQAGTAAVITPGGPTTFCQGGSVTLTATSGALNYLWSNGATTQSIVVSSSGTFSFSMNTNTGCPTTSVPVTVTVNPMTVTANSTPTTVCNGQNVQLTTTTNASSTVSVIATSSNNTQVFIPDNNATGVTSPITISGIAPATLSSNTIVSVTLNLTHTYDGDLIISLISPSGNQINLSNRRGGGGDNFINTVFSMNATTAIGSGSAPFTGSYVPDGAFSSLTGNINGTWLLKVADVAAVDTGRIQNWTLRLYNQVPNVVSYSWASNPSGFSSTAQNPSAAPGSTTTYTVTTSDLSGCTGTGSVTVTVNPNPVITISTPVSICTGSNTTLTASGALNYSWSPSTGLSSTTGSNVIASPLTTTTYTVTGTDANGCSSTAQVTVTVNSNLTVSVSPSSSICEGSNTTLTASGALNYSWSPSTGLSSTTGSNVIASPLTTTTYTVTGTDANGCSGTAQVTVSINPIPVVSVSSNTTNICAGQSAMLTANGATTYVWSPPTGLSSTTGISVTASPTSTTTYTVIGTTNGCSNSASITIIVGASSVPAQPGTITGSAIACPNSFGFPYSVVSVAGATGYTWTMPAGATVSNGAGTISVTVDFFQNFTSGNICVTANNVCGNSIARCKSVSGAIPARPSAINGQSTGVCNSIISYTANNVSGATSYNWTAPAGSSIISGQGTSSVQLQIQNGFNQGSLCVIAVNSCGSSNSRCLTLKGAPAKPVSVIGPSTVCANQTNVTYSTSPVAGATTYNWTVPGSATLVSGQGHHLCNC